MSQKSGGFRQKTRSKLRKRARTKGKVSTTKLLQEFKAGDRVIIKIEPAIQAGMPNPRFKSKVGTIIKAQGKSYLIQVKDGNKPKKVISTPVHLERI